ncbi:hypothetical protein [Flavobacterium undicola]|uniref:hypothetical protein n=1 Tax=Flavobacterium undicola TaxID=1932779 RepID=UPI0013773718|nr:hypothetical protein [Flavobacterium undicola]MBA0882732.1 hypothetical protein [Flavobacterium undicola]
MEKKQLTLDEWIELYIQATATLNSNLKKNTQVQQNFEKKIGSINIKPDLTDIIINQEQYFEKINLQSQKHIQLIDESCKNFQKPLQKFNSRSFHYLLILNFCFFVTTGISIYVAIKKSIKSSELIELQNKNFELQSKISDLSTFFQQNPKSLKFYKKWHQEIKENH